ncbi:DUF2608 domain-containing protein [Candidatus Dependentiae bacterium]|nr:DUF2608 domain-containing protein [Candidatus Dependentiae bacterium]
MFNPNIKEIYSLKDVESELFKLNSKSLVAFDIDDTLTIPSEPFFQILYLDNKFFQEPLGKFLDSIKQKNKNLFLSHKQKNIKTFNILSLVFDKTVFNPIEKQSIKLIKRMLNLNINVIGLTALSTGSFGVIGNLQDWRIKTLRKCGYYFSKRFEIRNEYFSFSENYNGLQPAYKQGVLFSAGNSKGLVLHNFLKEVNFIPEKVVFFDDLIDNCVSVARALYFLSIPYCCYLYKGAFKELIQFDQKIINYQYEHLVKYNEFLTFESVSKKIYL